MRKRFVIAAHALFVMTLSLKARATDPFEIQVYDGTANPRGALGLELHSNAVLHGMMDAVSPELPQNHQTHFTLEPSFGIFDFWEVGGYLQTTVRADGGFDYAGTKLRSKFVTPPSWSPYMRLGINLELSLLPEAYDRNRWGSEVRPILAWENEDWLVVLNPIIDTALAGPERHDGPSFQPAVMAVRKVDALFSFGVEYYGNFGPFSSFKPLQEQEQYLFEVVNLLAIHSVEVNVGVGEGFTAASNPLVVKMILGYTWERLTSTAPPARAAWH
jgi:hypothetical protein